MAKSFKKILNYIQKKKKTHMKENKKKTRKMKHDTRINARNKSWKDIKTKERKNS